MRRHGLSQRSQRLAYLENKTAELERRFAEARSPLQDDLGTPNDLRSPAGRRAPAGSRQRQPRLSDDHPSGYPGQQAAFDLRPGLRPGPHDAANDEPPVADGAVAASSAADRAVAARAIADWASADTDSGDPVLAGAAAADRATADRGRAGRTAAGDAAWAETDWPDTDLAGSDSAGNYWTDTDWADTDSAGTGPADADWADTDSAGTGWADTGWADSTTGSTAARGTAARNGATAGTSSADAGPAGAVPDESFWFDDPTETIVTRGRSSTYRRAYTWPVKASAVAVAALLLAVILALILSGGNASWPASVPVVQGEVTVACQNPNIKSEPDQVNFACGKSSQQILWVFALLTSNDNPAFSDLATGRQGLEPITPAQGGEVAWSLNLHHPYSPADPVDSLEVAARAINNIVGGATLTSTNGRAVVQPGLESSPANCLRYTGSAQLISRSGFPAICARPVTSTGQAALVADIYRHWVVGAAPAAAQDATVLFENAKNPGAPQVQAILKHLPNRKLLA